MKYRSFRFFYSVAAVAFFAVCPLFNGFGEDLAVVRLSYVSGTVQLGQNGQSQFDKAVVNMPLFEGARLTTAQDGQAEVEFADGSVARLSPNSVLLVTHLQPNQSAAADPSSRTSVELVSGLGYFELNVGQGQKFAVKAGPATIRPQQNSIFRVDLDAAPEVAVFQGAVHVNAIDGALSADVTEHQALHFDAADPSQNSIAQTIVPDSWDQWNIDRDNAIAAQAQAQTPVRNETEAAQDPGWNDLDANGNWYPVDGYGNVWVPNGTEAGWDPFGYGYWANYPTYGVTWISGYPWGWLPYHCGAWNYFEFGWGWVPGGCGAGWLPIVPVWSMPPHYRLPLMPSIATKPGVAVAGRNFVTGQANLIMVNRGAIARGPWAGSAVPSRVVAEHTTPIRLGGNAIQPIAPAPAQPGVGFVSGVGARIASPAPRSAYTPLGARVPDRSAYTPVGGQAAGSATRPPGGTRPVYAVPPASRPEPAARPAAPPAASGRPH